MGRRSTLSHRAGAAGPYLLFVVCPLVLFPASFLAVGMLDGGDDAASNLPMLYHSARALLAGTILWTPDLFLGAPLLAEPEFATFYPVRLLLLAFDYVAGFRLYLLLHYFGAQAGAYVYLRAVGASRAAAVFGAIAYGFCGFMIGHRGHTMYVVAGAWAPWFLALLHGAVYRGGALRFVGAALCFAAVPLAGAVQLTVYLGGLTVVLYATQSWSRRSLMPLALVVAALAPAALIALLQALPSMELSSTLAMSARRDFALSTAVSWHPAALPSLLLINAKDGAEWYSRVGMAVALAAAAGVGFAHRRPLVRAWGAVAVVAIVLMMGRHVPGVARALHELPVVGIFRTPARHNFELGVALAVLSAFGLDALVARRRTRWVWWAIGPAVTVGAWSALAPALATLEMNGALATYLATLTLTDALAPAIVAALFAVVVARPSRRPRTRIAVAVLLLAAETVAFLRADLDGPPREANYNGQLAAADPRDAKTAFARVMPPDETVGVTGLGGNAVLLLDGVQRLGGYASAVPADMAAVLQSNMHGTSRRSDDVRWSRLPSVYGVTHLVLPELVCDRFAAALDANAAKTRRCPERAAVAGKPLTTADRAHCVVRLGARAKRYALYARIARRGPEPARLRVNIFGHVGPSFRVVRAPFVPTEGSGLYRASVDLSSLPRYAAVELERQGGAALLVRDIGFSPDARRPRLNASFRQRRDASFRQRLDASFRQTPVRHHVRLAPGALAFDAGDAYAAVPHYLPIRPVVVRAEAPPKGWRVSSLRIGLFGERDGRSWNQSAIVAVARGRRHAVQRTFPLPPDTASFSIGAQPHDADRLTVGAVTASSACDVRRYRFRRHVGGGLALYENRDALPRVYSAVDVRRTHGIPAAVATIRGDDFAIGRSVTIEGAVSLPARLFAAKTIDASFGAQSVEVRVDAAAGPALVVVNDRWTPRWRASLDGRPAPLLRANALVRAVVVPKGRHTVRMTYAAPDAIWVGAVAAALGLLLAALALPRLQRRIVRKS